MFFLSHLSPSFSRSQVYVRSKALHRYSCFTDAANRHRMVDPKDTGLLPDLRRKVREGRVWAETTPIQKKGNRAPTAPLSV